MDPVDFDLEERPEPKADEYRPLSGLAIVALGLAFLSLAGWMSESLWFLALLGTLVAGLALRRIAASDPPMLGRSLARLALCVSLLNAVGVAGNAYVYRAIVDREARQFAEYWFELQLAGKTEKAAGLVKISGGDPTTLKKPGEDVVRVDRKEQLLKTYRDGPEVQTLLALGDRAQVRYYDTEEQERLERSDLVRQTYAITYDKEGTKTSFFVALMMERKLASDQNVRVWKITDIAGGTGAVPKAREAHARAARQGG